MSDVSGSGGGDINVAQEIAGLKQLIESGDTSQLTIMRILVLVEQALDRVWQVEQQLTAAAHNAIERSGP